ncbi:MAG TPA: hypothetical protein VF026_17130 [Ktedonobacteraceae bacterium]
MSPEHLRALATGRLVELIQLAGTYIEVSSGTYTFTSRLAAAREVP